MQSLLLFLLLFAALGGLLLVIKGLARLEAPLQEEPTPTPDLGPRGAAGSVKPLPPVLSSPGGGGGGGESHERTNEPANARSDADPVACQRLQLDRTHAALIEVLVYNGWGTTLIRQELKGTSSDLGKAVEEARQRLGLPPGQAYRTPIAGRPTAAPFRPLEHEDVDA